MIQFDEHIFQMGWFNHQLDTYISLILMVHVGILKGFLAMVVGSDSIPGMLNQWDDPPSIPRTP